MRCRGRPESVRVLSAEAPEEDTDEMEAERKLQELLKVLDTARVSPALFLSLPLRAKDMVVGAQEAIGEASTHGMKATQLNHLKARNAHRDFIKRSREILMQDEDEELVLERPRVRGGAGRTADAREAHFPSPFRLRTSL